MAYLDCSFDGPGWEYIQTFNSIYNMRDLEREETKWIGPKYVVILGEIDWKMSASFVLWNIYMGSMAC